MTRCLVVVLPVFGLREEGSARGAGGAGGGGGARLRKRLVSGLRVLCPPHPNHERVLPVDLYRNALHPCFR